MTVTASSARTDFNYAVNVYGEILSIKYYTKSIAGAGSYYDDDIALTQSGNTLWGSGVIFPIGNPKHGSSEALLLEVGKLLSDDMVIYMAGSVSTSGAGVKIGLGSPVEEQYQIILPGVDHQDIQGVAIYKKAYIRILPNGSLMGE